jgi:hypothetical protein
MGPMSSEKKGFFTRPASARLRLIDKPAEGLSRPPRKIPGFLNALPLKRTAGGPHTDNPDVKTGVIRSSLLWKRILTAQKCWMHVQHFEKPATLMGSPRLARSPATLMCAGPRKTD